MRHTLFYPVAIVAALGRLVQSKAVFAHYMLGAITEDHAHQDVDDAIAMGLDGFSLNVGDATPSWVGNTLNYMFGYAQYRGFKLFISMDVYASGDSCYKGGNSCNGPYDYKYIFDAWLDSSAYYQVNGKPLVSTYSSGGFYNNNWTDWRASLGREIFFLPDFDETEGYYESAPGWWEYWGDVVDGIFSWETAWPERSGFGSLFPGDVSVDVPVLKGAHDHSKLYMLGLSPLQYKDSYGANVYRGGDLNLPTRMTNILNMNPQPDFIQFQTWNDGPESHYIGSLWPEQNTDDEPWFYANEEYWSHKAWQPLVSSFIDAYKNGKSAATMDVSTAVAVGAAWYKTILPDSITCPYDGSSKYYGQPDGLKEGDNYLYYAVIISQEAPVGYTLDIHAGGKTTTVGLKRGLNMGSSGIAITPGAQSIELKDSFGDVFMSAAGGMCVSSGCPSYIYNSNYQVLPFKSGSQSAQCTGWAADTDGQDCTGSASCHLVVAPPGDDWQHVPCTNPTITDASKNPWDVAFSEQAWSAAVRAYKLGDYSLSFPESISNYFHGPPGMSCDILNSHSGCDDPVKCDNITPAGYVILNGFVALYQMVSNMYDGFGAAQLSMTDQIGKLTSTFAAVPSPAFDLNLILDVVTLGFSVAVSPIWKDVLDNLKFTKDDADVRGTFLDPWMADAVSLTKDAASGDDALDTQNDLTSRLGEIVKQWQAGTTQYLATIFNGTNSNALHSAITNGQMWQTNYQPLTNDQIRTHIEKSLYSIMIPMSWQLSKNNNIPVILNTTTACGKTAKMEFVSSGVVSSSEVCVGGTIYVLVGAWDTTQECASPFNDCNPAKFDALEGIDTINAGKDFGGVTAESLVTSAVNGYVLYGNRNGISLLDPTNPPVDVDLSSVGPTSAGVVTIPICDEDEAYSNWSNYMKGRDKSANYPCN